MISIAEIFDNSKELLDSISGFVDKYIGTELLRKCHITKVVDNHRTLEDLFHQVQREVINAMMDTAIIIIVDALLNAVRKCFNATEEQMNLLLVEFIGELPESWKSRFQLPASAQMHSRG